MIEICELVKKYGNTCALNGLSLEIPRGELFVLLGPNGAGKSTTIKVMAGLLKPTQGAIRIGGHDVVKDYSQSKRLLRYVPDVPYLYEKLTGREFLEFVADLYRVDRRRLWEGSVSILERFEILEQQEKLIETYSHGMRQKLIMTASLVSGPPLLIIDEPMVGLDPGSARTLKQLLKKHTADGGTVFLSTHQLSLAEEISDRIGIVHEGRLIACGALRQLQEQCAGAQGLEQMFLQLTGGEPRNGE